MQVKRQPHWEGCPAAQTNSQYNSIEDRKLANQASIAQNDLNNSREDRKLASQAAAAQAAQQAQTNSQYNSIEDRKLAEPSKHCSNDLTTAAKIVSLQVSGSRTAWH
ncbi:hypothetical protein IPL68_05275 [Candidatus Saccharibacteria bacterium]|nr:MAG: hypothetical protein IPL68_05275 [Candidatus Saccharibacteria bacterium]